MTRRIEIRWTIKGRIYLFSIVGVKCEKDLSCYQKYQVQMANDGSQEFFSIFKYLSFL